MSTIVMAAAPPSLPLRESDLYPPVRDLLVALGWTVRGEVGHCDLAAIQGDELVAVELKRSFNATVLIQATNRQRACDSVYVAVPSPKGGQRGRSWRGQVHLLKRLELGLILVHLAPPARAEIVFHPLPFQRHLRSEQRRAILREISGRSGDDTLGGTTGQPRVTAYREKALRLALLLETGPSSPKYLRQRGADATAGAILRTNHYGWYERLAVGSYGLTNSGRQALITYGEIVARHRAVVATWVSPPLSP